MAAYTLGTGDFPVEFRCNRLEHFKEAAGQTFQVGDLLVLQTTADKGDQIKLAGADPAAGTVVGIAYEAASEVEDTLLPVSVLDEGAEFKIPVNAALDRDHIGDEFGVVADPTTRWKLDVSETTAKVFRVVKIAPGYAHGDTGGKYIVKSAVGVAAVFAT